MVILLIGHPMKPNTGNMMDLEGRLIDFLTGHDYKVWYKAHPDRLKELGSVFDKKCRVIRQPIPFKFFDRRFIRNWWMRYLIEKADYVFFTDISTTAFHFALKSGKQIITLDLAFKCEPLEETFRFLKTRIKIVPTYSVGKKIIFDKEKLFWALESLPKPTKPWNTYIGKFKKLFNRGFWKIPIIKVCLMNSFSLENRRKALNARKHGYRIIGFAHGWDLGLLARLMFSVKPWLYVDEFVVYTNQIAENHKYWINRYFPEVEVLVKNNKLFFV